MRPKLHGSKPFVTEYQERGSAHIHILSFLDPGLVNAPSSMANPTKWYWLSVLEDIRSRVPTIPAI
ncbi:hypothetical protein C8R46DRAFT_1211201 [Mycena filopes]|nr:hypothetical protein C8R46DRAFT_1211201 [Mycena filopes]